GAPLRREPGAGPAPPVNRGVHRRAAGYASLVQNRVAWQRHLGEIRTQVGPALRSRGLGRALAGEIFSIGRERGLRKIVAQMTTDQKGAIATFERLGFKP